MPRRRLYERQRHGWRVGGTQLEEKDGGMVAFFFFWGGGLVLLKFFFVKKGLYLKAF